MSVPRLSQVEESQTRFVQMGDEYIHLRPHWSDQNGYHVDVYDSSGKKIDHRYAGY